MPIPTPLRRVLLGSTGFSPLSMGNTVLWLDASAITGLSDGASVAQWNDLSGNANHFTQATGSKQPTFETNVKNGRPGVQFDGGDVLVSGAINLTGTDDITVFIVSDAGNDQMYLEMSTDASAVADSFYVFHTAGGNLNVKTNGDVGASEFTVTATHTGYHVITMTADKALSASEIKAWVDADGTGTYVFDSNNTNAFGNRAFHLGGRGTTPTLGVNARILEVIVYSRAVSDANRLTVLAYLRSKYGI